MKIDILMATYNGEKYLEEQLNSILNQSYTDFRLLISDDCSSDSTIEILKEYVKKDNRVIVFFQEKNLGVLKNFEFLMNQVENDFFMFSDQDDVWKIDKIKKSVELMKKTNSDLVYSDLNVVDECLNIVEESYWKLKGFNKKIKYNNFESLYLNNYITGSTMLVKSKWIKKILPMPQKSSYILHDYWTALMVSQEGKITYLEEPQVMYRQHSSNEVGSRRRSDSIKDFDELRGLFIDVKIDHFNTFVNKNDRFINENIQKLNNESKKYFDGMKKSNKLYLKNSKLFWKLYKYELFSYSLKNYVILNIPIFSRLLFKIKK